MGPFPDGVYRAQFPYYYRNPEGMPQEAALDYYLNSIKDVFEQCGPADSIAAIVVEPLQGEGGFIPAPIEEGTEKVDYTVYIWYNVSIKYRRCFYDRTTAEIDAKSIHGNI